MSHVTTAPFATAFRLLVGFVARTSPPRFTGLVALAALEGLLGPLVMAATGLAVARAPTALGAGAGSAEAYDLGLAILLVGLAFGAGQLLAPIRVAVSTGLGSMVAQRIRQCLLDATLSPPGIAHLEDAATADEIQRAGEFEWADLAPMSRIVTEFGSMVSKVVTAAGGAVLLTGFAWWAPVVLVAGMVASHVWMAGNEHAAIEQHEEYAPLARRADYFATLSHDPPAAKEVRLFGLVDLLVGQTRAYRTEFGRHVWRARRAKLRPVLATIASIAVATGIVLGALAYAAIEGRIDAAGLTVAVQAIYAIELLGSGQFATWWVRQGAAALPHLRALPARTSALSFTAHGTASAAGMPRSHIQFSDVSFRYPGHDRPVLDRLSLEIRAGESLAIVGENGEGKTTLLKLLTRLYDPTEGAVLVDGHDLRDLDLASWRAQMAVIFQDFVRYELSARTNIGFGRVAEQDDAAAAERAAARVGARELIEGLPAGWGTVLARQYRDGVDLSGGQWQRIALARALRAAEGGARLLVLDEPTAALDVRAEAELFDVVLRGFQGVGPLGGQSLDLTAGVTTLLVTHRLSSVRRADRIAVVGGGRVVETGTHDELLAADGVYARMFGLQAQRFATGASHG